MDNSYDWGALFQAGYMIDKNIEIFGRWDVTVLDKDLLAAGEDDTLNEFTIGANYYIYGHNAKFTVDIGYLPDGSPVSAGGLGVLATGDDEIVLRAQLQLAI